MSRIGRYELKQVLGHGAFGAVHRAEVKGPLGFTEELAVKVMHPSVAAADPDALPGLADEARILSHLRHPNIVGLRGFEEIEQDGETHHVLVLEYVRGVTVDQILMLLEHLKRPLSPIAIMTLFDDALSGLEHAHKATGPDGEPLGLVHRDLKPPNLMVDTRGNLRILDFGIALARERLVHTMVGRTKGSPPWMSPEQVRGDPLDARSDLWVLATIVYKLLTGEWWVRPASTREEASNVLRVLALTTWQDRREALTAQLSKKGRLPMKRGDRKLIEALLESLLNHDRTKRPASAADVRVRLRNLSFWNLEKGHETLGSVCRGILKAGPRTRPDATPVAATRKMPKVTQLTNPGTSLPTENS
ncbi:MAG: serine/threonine protein kinase [Deltaproteobacteria bacterium]|nr:serine/threonine protein kinase [Deltaproteobacteria bacterium]